MYRKKRVIKKSQFDVLANVELLVYDVTKNNKLIDVIDDCNLFVTDGRNQVRDFLNNLSPTGITHLAVGTDATGAVLSDSALGTEVYRNALTKRTPSDASVMLSYYLASTQANGNTLAETGLFNDPTAGAMFARATYTPIIKTSSIAVMYNWTLNIGG